MNSSNKSNIKLNVAFTLVELIVVITILAILWTIAFISLQWYSASARDSKRVSDIQNIKKSLELFSLNTWKYPLSDNYNTVSYSWEDLWYQWIVWDWVVTNLSRNLNKKPTDPLTELEYTYSVINSQTQYEVLAIYESDIISLLLPWVIAAEQTYPKVEWTYNWLYVKSSSYYVPTPSIINGNLFGNIDFVGNTTFLKSQVITWWDNLPWVSTWWLDIALLVYTWSITDESSDIEKITLANIFKWAYTWSSLVSDTLYADLLATSGTWEIVTFIDNIVLNNVSWGTVVNNNSNWSVCTFGSSTFWNCVFE